MMVAGHLWPPGEEGAMKVFGSIILLSFSGGALAQQSVGAEQLGSWAPRDASSCNSIYGDGRQLCLADRYHMQQDQKARDEQSFLQRAQAENQQLSSALLVRELTAPTATTPVTSADIASVPGYAAWQAENRWYGADRARTEYAILYAKDLHQQQPDLAGRAFLNALSARVKEIFASSKR
jgi:hypothetical protein